MAKPVTIHTLKSLRAKTIEIGKCWIWQGYVANKTPQIYYKGSVTSVRRVIVELRNRQPVPKDIYISTSCENCMCINPHHYIYRTHQEHMSYMAKNLDQGNIQRRIKLSEAARKRGLQKLSDEQIKDILVSDLSGAELGRQLNVSRGLVALIRRGKNRSLDHQLNNPFAGLMK